MAHHWIVEEVGQKGTCVLAKLGSHKNRLRLDGSSFLLVYDSQPTQVYDSLHIHVMQPQLRDVYLSYLDP